MNIIDLAILIIIIIFMIIGLFKGLISSVIGLVGYFLSMFLAYKLSPFFAKFMIEKWAIDEKINGVILAQIPKIAENMINNNEQYKNMIETSGQSIEAVSGSLTNIEIPFMDVLTTKIIQILSVIILFIILKFLFGIIGMVLNRIAKLPVLDQINRIGGLAIGLVEGIIVSVLLLVVVNLVPNEQLQENVNNSFIGNKVGQTVVDMVIKNTELNDLQNIEYDNPTVYGD